MYQILFRARNFPFQENFSLGGPRRGLRILKMSATEASIEASNIPGIIPR